MSDFLGEPKVHQGSASFKSERAFLTCFFFTDQNLVGDQNSYFATKEALALLLIQYWFDLIYFFQALIAVKTVKNSHSFIKLIATLLLFDLLEK